MSKVLILIPEIPGYYSELCLKISQQLKTFGIDSVFACVSPYVIKWNGLSEDDFKNIHYLSEFNGSKNTDAIDEVKNWYFYSTFVRQRYFFGKHMNNQKAYESTFAFFEHIFNKYQDIKAVFSEGVSNSFLHIAYILAKKNKIPNLGFVAGRTPNSFNIHIDDIGNSVLKNTTTVVSSPSDKAPDYMSNSNYGHLFDLSLKEKFRKIILFFTCINSRSLEIVNNSIYSILAYVSFLKRFLFEISLRLRKSLFDTDVDFTSNKVIILFPIHFRPEASTSIYAKYYESDYEVIKNIAFSMSTNMQLIVKEHSVNIGNNSIEFYKKIKDLPGTKLLSPYFNLKKALHNFDAVITLSSTVGFEALQKGVKVGVLGDVFYQKYPGATKLKSYSELESYIGELTKTERLERRVPEIDSLYAQMCFSGNFNYMSKRCLDSSNVEALSKEIEKVILGKISIIKLNL